MTGPDPSAAGPPGGPGRPDASDPSWWSIAELRDAYRRGEVSPVAVVDRALDRLDELDPVLHLTLARRDEAARREAVDAERALTAGEAGPLTGVPITVKDLSHVAGTVTTFGSLVHDPTPQPLDSGAVRRLRSAGAIVLAKTNASEYGQSATTENRLGPPCRNPWDVTRTPGGSSGGAGVSVAAGVVPLALGSDGGGSVRIPAAFTGTVGFKPTQGHCLDEGGCPGFDELATVGPLTRTVDDARRAFAVLAGTDAVPARSPDRLRIGVVDEVDGRPIDPPIRAELERVAERLAAAGAEVEPLALDVDGWQEIFDVAVLEGERCERVHLLEHEDRLTDTMRRVLRAAQGLEDPRVRSMRAAWPAFRRHVDAQLAPYHALLTPAVATLPFPIDRRPRLVDGHRVGHTWGAFSPAPLANVVGLPAIALPTGWVDHLPVGVQLLGARNDDARLLTIAGWVETVVGRERRVPPQPIATSAVTAEEGTTT